MKRGKKDKFRPIMVKFASRRLRDSIMIAKKNLSSDSEIFISEHLTKSTTDIFMKARAMKKEKKLHAAWTYKGQVFVRKTDEATSRPTLIKSVQDLSKFG